MAAASTDRPRVLVVTDISYIPEVRQILEAATEVNYQPTDRQALLDHVGDCDALWGHVDLKIDREVLDCSDRLRVVNVCATGTDHIDKDELARRGIRLLCIAKDFGLLDTFTATAECAWLLLLACARQLRSVSARALNGGWDLDQAFFGRQLSGLTLGVLGVGRLGRMSVEYGKSFRMRVLGCDLEPFTVPGVEPVDFDTLLRESDAVLVHIHMTPENYHLFDASVFARMKEDAILVNTSRGDIVDENALMTALESGRLSGFGGDVVHDEWRDDMTTQPLVQYARTHANVVLTPHIGGATWASVVNARVFSARKLVHYLQTGEELTWPWGAAGPVAGDVAS